MRPCSGNGAPKADLIRPSELGVLLRVCKKTVVSMQRIADLLTKEKAQLWINYAKAQRSATA